MIKRRIDRVQVENYRSLADVDVELDDLTVLLGANGSGKSNFVDVLRFVRDALTHGLNAALRMRERGGMDLLRHHAGTQGRRDKVTIALSFTIDGEPGEYSFTVAYDPLAYYSVEKESCKVGGELEPTEKFEVKDNKLHIWREGAHEVTLTHDSGELLLNMVASKSSTDGNLSGAYPLISNVRLLLRGGGFYTILPNVLRTLQRGVNDFPLKDDGANLASVLQRIMGNKAVGGRYKRGLEESLVAILPDLREDTPISVIPAGSFLIVTLNYKSGNSFDLALESDGTIRVLALLTALHQYPALPLLAIEEPESMIYPRATEALADVLKNASRRSQIIVTTHSPDLLACFKPNALRYIERDPSTGATRISPLREELKQVIHDDIFGAGDLLRLGAMQRD